MRRKTILNQTNSLQSTETKPPEQFFVENDGEWGIFLFNDSNNNCGIQVALFCEKRQLQQDGSVVSAGKTHHVVWSKLISTETDQPSGKRMLLEDAVFMQNLKLGMAEARQELARWKRKRQMILQGLREFCPKTNPA